jgi:hypothetical protein
LFLTQVNRRGVFDWARGASIEVMMDIHGDVLSINPHHVGIRWDVQDEGKLSELLVGEIHIFLTGRL